MEILIIILSFLLMFIGLVGIFLPFLPGVPLVWLGLFIYSIFTGFFTISKTTIFIFLGLTALTMLVDFIAPLIGVKKYQVSRYGLWGTFFGLVFGVFIFGPLGIILGPAIGVIIGELLSGKTKEQSFHTAAGVLTGFFISLLIKFIVVLFMFTYFIAALLF